MGSLMIGDFGEKKGVRTFRICGAKEDIYRVLEEAREMGHKFYDTPNILHVTRQQYTVLLQLKVATIGACKNADT